MRAVSRPPRLSAPTAGDPHRAVVALARRAHRVAPRVARAALSGGGVEELSARLLAPTQVSSRRLVDLLVDSASCVDQTYLKHFCLSLGNLVLKSTESALCWVLIRGM